MKTKLIAFLIALTLILSIACSIGYEGLVIGDDPEISLLEDQTATAASAQSSAPAGEAATPEPEYQPSTSTGSNAETANSGEHTYAVSATNFGCTCQVDGNMTVGFNILSDKLEYSVFGGTPDVYEKTGENTYKRTFMGYYILSSGSGAQATETVVEEERHTVIILNNGGYVMEHYQGEESSPCCYHTFTLGSTP